MELILGYYLEAFGFNNAEFDVLLNGLYRMKLLIILSKVKVKEKKEKFPFNLRSDMNDFTLKIPFDHQCSDVVTIRLYQWDM